MAITLEDFANADTDYVAKHNRNNTVLEVAVSALQTSVASSTVAANQNLPYLLQAMFGVDTTPNVIDENDCVCSIVGLTVEMTAGYAYLPGLGAVCYNSSTRAVDLTALGDGTYYITMNINGVPTYNITGVDGIYSVIKTGAALGTLTKLATNSFSNEAPLTVPHGGTGLATLTDNGVMVGDDTNVVRMVTSTSSGQMFRGAGSASPPTWSTTTWPNTATATRLLVCLTTNIISDLTSATNGVLVTSNSGAGVPSILAGPGATGRVLTSNAAAAPSWSAMTFPASVGATGTFLRSDGTNWIASSYTLPTSVSAVGTFLRSDGTNYVGTTLTIPNTAAVSTILYASATDVISALATAASGVLVTNGSSVPSIATDIPTAVTIGGAYNYRVGGTDVSVADGGTGLSTLTASALYVGNGASAPTALAVGATGTVLIGNTGANPSWSNSPSITNLTVGIGASGRMGIGSAPSATSYELLYIQGDNARVVFNDNGAQAGGAFFYSGATLNGYFGLSTTGLTVSATGQIVFNAGGDSRWLIDVSGSLKPNYNGGASIGSTLLGISNGFFATGAALTFGEPSTPNVTITHSAGVISISAGTSACEFRFLEPSGSGTNYTGFIAQAQSASITYTLPASVAGASGGLLTSTSGGALSWVGITKTLDVNHTAVGNVTTGEDDLITYTIPAATLGVAKDRIEIDASGTFANSVNNKRLRAYFGATLIFDSGALAITAATNWVFRAAIIRTGAATQESFANLSTSSSTLAAYAFIAAPTETLSGTVIVKLTGEATDTNDVVQETMITSVNGI